MTEEGKGRREVAKREMQKKKKSVGQRMTNGKQHAKNDTLHKLKNEQERQIKPDERKDTTDERNTQRLEETEVKRTNNEGNQKSERSDKTQ